MLATKRLPPLPTIRDLLKLYRLRALKQLSQNFLMDERITDRIVRAAGKIQNGFVCEVGPGPGGITRSIIKNQPGKLVVVEKDPRFIPILELLKESFDLDIVIGDILSYTPTIDPQYSSTWSGNLPKINMIGNLPFSVSTYLLIQWLHQISEQKGPWEYGRARMTLTFQKEVAERITAPIMSKQRCRLSVMCQMWCQVNHLFTIPGTAFVPKPEVDVGVVTLTPLKVPLTNQPFHLVEKVLRSIFNMRQKYAVRGAEMLFPEDIREECRAKLFELADIDPQIRPFQITNLEFTRIFDAYAFICGQYEDNRIINYNFRSCKQLDK